MRGKAKILDSEEFKRLMKFVSTNKYAKRDSLLIMFSFGLGLRAIEMAAIKVCHLIDEKGKLIETVQLPRTKGQKPRPIYITDKKIQQCLIEYIQARKLESESKRKIFSLNQPLFLSQKGSHFTNKTLSKLFDTIYKNSGLKATSHSGRRTFATNLIEKGVDIRSVQVLMGHSNINQTAEYVQHNPERLKRISADALTFI
jgi:integrase/recombinase XerD